MREGPRTESVAHTAPEQELIDTSERTVDSGDPRSHIWYEMHA